METGLFEPGTPLIPTDTICDLFTFGAFQVDGVEMTPGGEVVLLDVLANRPDCQGVLGLARELCALVRGGLPELLGLKRFPGPWRPESYRVLAPPSSVPPELTAAGRIGDAAAVDVLDAAGCPRYVARAIEGVRVGPSPEWLRRKLAAFGMIPRNNVVDVTNYVMLEMNQPLHAFDLDRLAGRRIIVRRAGNGERFVPLYGQCPPLTSETLVIADAERPVAIAGIIGGTGCEVTGDTRRILLEAACFDPASIRRTSRRLGIATDSSFRFERGVDIEAVDAVSARAAALIAEVAGGRVLEGSIDRFPSPPRPVSVRMRYDRCRRILGLDERTLPDRTARRLLEAAGFRVEEEDAEGIVVTVPSWRRRDVSDECHLIEECGRLRGYEAIPERLSMRAMIPGRSRWETDGAAIRKVLTALGYFEVWTDSLTDPSWPPVPAFSRTGPYRLANPLSSDRAVLRGSLLPSLLAVRRTNQDARATRGRPAKLFEIGRVYLPRTAGAAGGSPPLSEPWILGILDDRGPAYVMAAVSEVLAELGLSDAVRIAGQDVPPWCAPGKGRFLELAWDAGGGKSGGGTGPETSAAPGAAAAGGEASPIPAVVSASGNVPAPASDTPSGPSPATARKIIGYYGEAHPDWIARFDLKKACAVCEINISALADESIPRAEKRFEKLPRFPEVVRDVAMVVAEPVTWGEVVGFFASEAREPLIKEPPRFLSVYRGKQIGPGRKSLAFSLVYRHDERTLTDEEVNEAHRKVVERLLTRFGATLRA
ncbi:MAG: phenylalanine--tRNA ligase subunit beta [Planctomycetota bacterium]|nr:phenylalanine--tRNA ligase subunit beta [Planctomycetota bacterium]